MHCGFNNIFMKKIPQNRRKKFIFIENSWGHNWCVPLDYVWLWRGALLNSSPPPPPRCSITPLGSTTNIEYALYRTFRPFSTFPSFPPFFPVFFPSYEFRVSLYLNFWKNFSAAPPSYVSPANSKNAAISLLTNREIGCTSLHVVHTICNVLRFFQTCTS